MHYSKEQTVVHSSSDVTKSTLFGMLKDESKTVKQIMKKLRKARFNIYIHDGWPQYQRKD